MARGAKTSERGARNAERGTFSKRGARNAERGTFSKRGTRNAERGTFLQKGTKPESAEEAIARFMYERGNEVFLNFHPEGVFTVPGFELVQGWKRECFLSLARWHLAEVEKAHRRAA